MYFGEYTLVELAIFAAMAIVVIWAFWRIFTGSRHSGTALYWFIIVTVVLSLWAWRSGTAVYYYQKIKTEIGTPDVKI